MPHTLEDIHVLTELYTKFYEFGGAYGIKLFQEKGNSPVYAYVYSHRGRVCLSDFFAFSLPQLLIKVCNFFINLVASIHQHLVLVFQKFDDVFGTSFAPTLCHVGAGHGDELFLLFDTSISVPFEARQRASDVEMTSKLVELWTNFATFGSPTLNVNEWPRYVELMISL